MSFNHLDKQFPPRSNLKPGAEVVSLCLRDQPYLANQDVLGSLVAYALAQRTNGVFIANLDDTDPDPLKVVAQGHPIHCLINLDISPNEFMDIGDYEPHFWSQRRGIYKEVAMHLVEQDYAYHCFCHNLQERDMPLLFRRSAQQEDHCRCSHSDQACERLISGEKYLLRFRVPFSDEQIDAAGNPNTCEDFVLLTPEGMPMPYFAHVVDNHFMRVTTQVRRNNTRSMLEQEARLYQALGWEMPKQVFIPDIDDSQATGLFEESQLDELLKQGYLSEVLINFFTNLLWKHPEGKVIFPLEHFVEQFDVNQPLPDTIILDYELLNRIQAWYSMR